MTPEFLKKLPIPFPLQGLSENYSASVQEPLTTRDLLNVRAIDPRTGRTRGAQRSGLNRWLDDVFRWDGAALNGIVKEINMVPLAQTQLTYATDPTPNNVFAKALANQGIGVDLKMDDFGNLYVAQATNTVEKFNQDGALLATIDVPDTSPEAGAPEIRFVEIDDRQNVFCGRGYSSTPSAAEMAQARMYAFEFQTDGTYRLAWTLDTGRFINDGVIHKKGDGKYDMFLLEVEDHLTLTPTVSNSYFTVYRDVDLTFSPVEETASRVTLHSIDNAGGQLSIAMRMAKRPDGVCYATGGDLDTASALDARVWKVNPYGDDPSTAIWTLWNNGASGDDIAGVGYGIAVGPKNADGDYTFYTCGNDGPLVAGDSVNVRRIVDEGTTFNELGTGWWAHETVSDYDETTVGGRGLRLATDQDGNLYLPAPTAETEDVLIFDADAVGDETGSGPVLNGFAETAAGDTILAVAVPQTKPEGHSGASIEETEHVYFTSTVASITNAAFFKNRMSTLVQAVGTFRNFTFLAMGREAAGGSIEKFTQGGTFTDPSGGTGINILEAAPPYIQSATFIARHNPQDKEKGRHRIYITDGSNYKKYDPSDDAVSNWTNSTAGIIPPRCRLIESGMGRLWLGRDPENPTAWHASAINNPEDWDNFPAVVRTDQAISGVNAKAGNVPDILNTMIPWDDDTMLFGCDHSIWVMRGNPMLGGQFDLLTDQHGMPFGRPWTKDHTGQSVFYLDTMGGLHMLSHGSAPVRISRDRIERRLQDNINWSTHYVRLVWNRRDEGLHIFQLPYGIGGTLVKHWFWDRKNDFWGEDQFGRDVDSSFPNQPTAVFLVDGDAPDDRALLLACEDGRIRVWDEESPNDDYATATTLGAGAVSGGDAAGDAIDSFVTIGPLQPQDAVGETQFTEWDATLAYDQDGVNFEFFVGDEPDDALNNAPKVSGKLHAGRNPTKLVRFTGDTAFLRMRNANPNERWAYEKSFLAYSMAGQRMKRRG